MKVAIPLAKNVLAWLEITVAASTIDAGIQKKLHGSRTTTLIISNKEMNYIMKIVQALEDSNILLKRVTKKTKNEKKRIKRRILKHVVGYFRSQFVTKFIIRKGILRAGSRNKKKEL